MNGSFEINCKILLSHIYNLNNGKMKICFATSKTFAKMMKKSPTQINRIFASPGKTRINFKKKR